MDNKTLFKDSQTIVNLLKAIIEAFSLQAGTAELAQQITSYEIKPDLIGQTAYRYIILSEGLEDSPERAAQLNWQQITEPYRSWSKTRTGAEYFSSMHGNKDSYRILIEGEVKGFVLLDYSQKVIEEAKKLAKQMIGDSKYFHIEESLRDYILAVNTLITEFSKEEEIVVTDVISYRVIEQYA